MFIGGVIKSKVQIKVFQQFQMVIFIKKGSAIYVVKNCNKYGIKCFWWDQGGKYEVDSKYGYTTGMGLLNRYNLTWVYPEIVKAFTDVKTEQNKISSADVNCDGKIDSKDLVELRLMV